MQTPGRKHQRISCVKNPVFEKELLVSTTLNNMPSANRRTKKIHLRKVLTKL